MDSTNIQILKHIISYADQINEATSLFNGNLEQLKNNTVYRNAVALCVLQIGELSNHLTEDYRNLTSGEIPWREIRGLRNIVAHHYGKIDYELLWETVSFDVPNLKSFCEKQISVYEALNEEAEISDEFEE